MLILKRNGRAFFRTGEQGVVIGFLNSFVHIFMYFYYMVAALGPRYRKYLWWKKYMTWIQLIQFTIMLTYLLLIVIFDCKLHRALTAFFLVNVIIFLYLFTSFYLKAYSQKRSQQPVGDSASTTGAIVKRNGLPQMDDTNNNNNNNGSNGMGKSEILADLNLRLKND